MLAAAPSTDICKVRLELRHASLGFGQSTLLLGAVEVARTTSEIIATVRHLAAGVGELVEQFPPLPRCHDSWQAGKTRPRLRGPVFTALTDIFTALR